MATDPAPEPAAGPAPEPPPPAAATPPPMTPYAIAVAPPGRGLREPRRG